MSAIRGTSLCSPWALQAQEFRLLIKMRGQLVSSRYEHGSLILTSNLPFARWGYVFGDQVVAAAMIDRIVHHAEVITLKGSSYRLKNKEIDTLPSARAENTAH